MPFKTPLGERATNQIAPTFIRPLQDKRVVVGQSVKLECQVDGHPDPVIKWLKDGQNVTNCPDYELSQNGKRHILTISSAQGADCGRFTLQAMNSAGIKQSTCLLIVAPAPTPLPGATPGAMSIASSPVPASTPIGPNAPFFLKELRNQVHKPSNACVFEARVVAVPPPEIVWLKNNEELNNYRAKTEYDPQSGIALLTIPQLFPEDLGEYTCRATNSIGTTECSAFLLSKEEYDNWLSNEKTSFYKEKKQRMIARNQQQQYQSGHRTPQQRPFQSRGLLSPNFSDSDIWNISESETEPELANLHLHAQRRDFVGVSTAPAFRTQLRNLKLTEGTDAILQCQITGNPKPQIYWLKNGRLMQPSGTPRIQFVYKGNTVMLKILEVIQSDSGEYTLCLENSAGKVENAARIEVFPLPSKPTVEPPKPSVKSPPATSPKPQQQFQQREQISQQIPVRQAPQQQFPAQQTRSAPSEQFQQIRTSQQIPVRQAPQQQFQPRQQVQIPASHQIQRQQVEYRRQEQSRPAQQPEIYYNETFRTSRPQQIQQVAPQPVQRRQIPVVEDYHHYTEPIVVRSPQQQTVHQTPASQQIQKTPHYAQPYQAVQEEHFYSAPLVKEQRRQPDQFAYQQYLEQLDQLKKVNHQKSLEQRPSEAIDEFLGLGIQRINPLLERPKQEVYLQEQREFQTRQFYPQEYRHNRMAPPVQQKGQQQAAVNGNAAGGKGQPPQFSQMPQSTYVNVGEKASFTAKASGTPVPTLEWTRNGKVLNDPKKYQISGKDGQSQLTINSVAEADYGSYTCNASNPSGKFSAQFQIANAQAPKRKHDQSEGDERERVTLRKVDRSKQLQNARLFDDQPPPSKEPPKFASQLKNLTLNEGQHALLDCKFGPTDDANLKIAWLLNGRAIVASSRISTITEFGYTVLEINPVTVFDHGEYTVVAVNQLGEARQSAIVEVVGHRSDSVNTYLQRTQRETSVPVPAAPQKPIVDRPNFHQEIRSQEIFEGQPLHLETKLTPINDSSLKVTFLLNGSPLKGDGRVQTQYQAGFVVISIPSASAQDAGEYTIIAENEAGSAETSATIIVAPTPQVDMAASQIYDADDAREIQFSQNAGQITAPRFVQPIRDFNCEFELGRSYFDARYEPSNDPTVRVEWLHNGTVLANANRIQYINNFGFVSLTIHPSYPEDEGTYTCRITSSSGQAESSANLTVVAPETLQLDSRHESALSAINDIEGFEVHIGPLPVERPEEEVSIEAPRFSRPLGGKVEANQEEAVHFEARVLPANDIKMNVTWLKDGAPLPAAHRYRPQFDFGYIALDILYCYPEDSGTYTCVATNELGSVESSIELSVTGAETLYLDPQHPEGLDRIAELDQPRIFGIAEVPDRESDNPPSFLSNLQDIQINEYEDFVFDLKLKPANDPTMTITWTLNGQPLYEANRFKPLFEFDRVQLRVKGAIPEDSGVYVCTARNALGESSTSATLTVLEGEKILADTQHDQSLSKIEYLESLNKYAREEVVDFQPDTAPQFIQPLPGNLGEVEEGEFLHLEAKVEPVGDNTLQVYWLHNGRPLPSAHRLRPFYDFGFVSLDILSVYAEDSGQFTCVAENQHGKAETSVTINCQPKSRILDQTQHEASWQRVQELEAPKEQAPEEEQGPAAAPQFVQPLSGSFQVNEGESVFLEARYVPVDDNTLTHEWLFNGQPLQKAHRFAHTQDFGHVAMTILYVYPEDSGTYTLVLRNASGEAQSSVDIQCAGGESLLTDTFHESAIGRIAELEAPRPLPEEAPDADKVAPQIVKQLEAVPLSEETSSIHLEAQYLPIDDNTLQIEWYRDGAPLPHSNRYKLLKDFGYAALDINFLVAADAGEYTLVVSNEVGQAQTTTTIAIEDGAVLLLDTAHPESLRRIIELESVKPAEPEEIEIPPEAPQFTQQLTMPEVEEITEGIPLHMDATLIPVTDNKLTVTWYKDGQPLQFSSRIRNIFEFGYVALEFQWIIAEDSGTYTCVAQNEHGEAQTSLSFEVGTKRNLYLESQHDESWKKIQELENRVVEKEPSPELVFGPPTFTQNLENADEILEGSSVRLLCRVQPVADPTLKINWTLNGQPLHEGNRFRHSRNVDLIILDLVYALPEDEGLYSCVATSDYGQATTSATVKVVPIDALQLDTQHEASWQRVQELEAPKPEPEPLPDREKEPPRFTTNLNSVPELQEGQSAALFATVEPAWDNELFIEWYKDGQPLGHANRFKTNYALGNVYLNILYAFAQDSGVYTAVARNSVGEARSDVTIQVASSESLYLQPQSESSWQKVQALEAPKEKEAEAEEQPASAPQFIEQLQSLQRIEGQPAHFQTRVTPVNDNKLKIYWLKDGAPLPDANKFKHTYDFGLITLDISHTVANDAGTYSVVAENEQGRAQVDGQLTVEPLGTLLLDPVNQAAWQRVQELEAPKEVPAEAAEVEYGPPHFTSQLQSAGDLVEGQPVHFEANVVPINDPDLKIIWLQNGREVRNANRFSIRNDFGLVTLDISYVLSQDIGDWTCRAVNKYGQDETTAHLECEKRPNILSDTIHDQSWQRIQEIEAPKEPAPEPEAPVYPPPQFTQPLQSQADVPENSLVIFEGQLIPVGDPSMQIQWFLNDTPIQDSNRHAISYDFGYVALRINGATSFDNGTYSCKAVNDAGATISNASLTVGDSEGILGDAINPASFQKITQLEAIDKNARLEVPEQEFGKPSWVKTFENVDLEDEGAILTLEGYVDPADDPNLRVEWFLNNTPLQNSNRHRCELNFGQVILSIVHVLPHDSGVYTCRAYNAFGEATTSATVKVAGYEKLLLNTQHESSWQKIQELEAPKIVEEVEIIEEKEKPRFLTHLENATDVPEGTPIKLEATFQPARDNDLSVEWLFNDQPLGASQLIKTRSELGWASLEINGVTLDHNGVFTLIIRNTEGEAATSATVQIAGIGDILGETSHPESWTQIQILEAPKPKEPTPPPPAVEAPQIQTQIADIECNEGDQSEFQAVFTTNDPKDLKVEWFRNGELLAHGNKYIISNDFGLAKLGIGYTFPEDEGVFQLKISNSAGEAVSSATLKCHPKDALLLDTMHDASWQRIQEIEAPKEPEPEPEPAPKVPPKFTSPLQTISDLHEHQSAHFEATLEPLDDNELLVQWFFNGAPFAHSNRAKMIHSFGIVILNIQSVDVRDTGTWECVATNSVGSDRVSATLNVTGSENIAADAINIESHNRIQQLEAPKEPAPEEEQPAAGPPQITAQLTAPSGLNEGDSVHLQATYSPVNDPNLKVEWLKDGAPLAMANKHKVISNFGFAVLDILYLLGHDAGEYTVRVYNDQGEATSSATIEVAAKESLLLDPISENKARAVQDLEDARNRRPEVEDLAPEERIPVFVQPLSAPLEVQQGDRAHFTATYEPINDPNVEISWWLNGRPINASRIKTLNEFGTVVLEIGSAHPIDSGELTCRAKNKVGEAVTSTKLNVTPTENIVSSTQLTGAMINAQQRIDEIENRQKLEVEEPEIVHGPPRFTTQFQQPEQLREGALLHVEAQLEPVGDKSLQVEWYHNGEPVRNSNRMKAIHDFGFVVLELLPAEPQDTGTWECVATNNDGEARASVNIEVVGDSGISYEWVSPGERRERIDQLEEYINRPKGQLELPEVDYEAPHFTENLQDLGDLNETEAASFICVLEPIGDPTMHVRFEHDGQPLPHSNRFQFSNDFGVQMLLIKYLIAQDSGTYTCIAENSKGRAETSATINVQTIIQTEEPQIVQPLVETIDAEQGESVHLECRVSPINDNKLKVYWMKDGQLLGDANRYRQSFEFGFVSFDILYALAEDSGDYELVVENDKGRTSTKCHVVVLDKPSLEFTPQAPGSTSENIEHHLRQFTRSPLALVESDAYDPRVQRAPEFKTQLLNVGVEEGDYCRFETQLAPFNDPYLKVEWFKDNVPLNIGSRFKSTLEFGYCCLDLLYALGDDTGEYTAVATNKFGQAMVSAKLACSKKKDVLTESQIPQGLKVRDINKKEDSLHWVETTGLQARTKEAPQFTIKPRNVQATEGQPARFECAVSGNPRPKVIWYINGVQALHGHRFKLNYDGVHYLTISQARVSDAGTVEAIARNTEGEVLASTTLDVFQRDDFRQQKLRQAQLKSSDELQQREDQWKVETLGSLGEAFEKAPKGDVTNLLKVERSRHPVEPLESEELVRKFTKPKDEQFYDKLTYVERQRPEFEGLKLETVNLKPGQIQRYQPEPEKVESVNLRQIQRAEDSNDPKRFASPPPNWASGDVKLDGPKGKFSQLDEPERDPNIPARDQVKLAGAKPKPAGEKEPIEHVRIEEDKARLRAVQQGPEIEPEKVIPHKDQIQIKQKYQPKAVSQGEHVVIEAEPLKGTPQVVKTEIERSTISNKPQPTKMVDSQKAAPTLKNQLQATNGELGRSAAFVVGFSGDAPINVKWFFNGRELRSAFDTIIKTTENETRLELSKIKANHAGTYTVQLSNAGGQCESTANLTVTQPVSKGSPPEFKQRISDQRAQQNSSIKFTCSVASEPKATISWFKDGQPIPNDVRFKADDSEVSLEITKVLAQDAGIYECVAKNPSGESRCKARLNVNLAKTGKGSEAGPQLVAPRFSTPLKPVVVNEGAAAEFRAKYTGDPEPMIRWYRNNEPVRPSRGYEVGHSNGECWMKISGVAHEHVAEYKCEASNPAGKASSVSNLVIKPSAGKIVPVPSGAVGVLSTGGEASASKNGRPAKAPQVIQKLSAINARSGENVKFVLQFDGEAQITWTFNNKPLTGNEYKASVEGNKSILQINKVKPEHAGSYACKLQNQSGSAQSAATLNVQSR